MPLGIAIGRYSTHEKISTECSDDIELPDTAAADSDPLPVRFIGQQNVPLYNSKNISGMMYQIYHKNYSPLKINLKKYELSVDASGITVFLAAAKKSPPKHLFMKYSLTDILLVTTDFQQDRLFAIIFYGPLRNCVLHLYLFNNEDDVRLVMNKCNDDFAGNRDIKQVEKCPYSDGLEIIHYKPYEKAKESGEEEDESGKVEESVEKNGTHSTEESKTNSSVHVPVLKHPPPPASIDPLPSSIDPPPSSGDVNNSKTPYTYTPTPSTPPPTLLEFTAFKCPYTNGKSEINSNGGVHLNDSFGEFQSVPTMTTITPVTGSTVKTPVAGSTTKTPVAGSTVKTPVAGSTAKPPVNESTVNNIPESPEERPTTTTHSNGNSSYRNGSGCDGNLMDDDELDDEFAELALKRNIYLPDHLQDKSIESTLLFPATSTNTTNQQNIKPGLFSSYNKLSS